MIDPKWDIRFLRIAREVSSWSKDPSTKVGAVITNGKRIISTGYNGFPESIEDKDEWLNDREKKYSMIVHAEMNAILLAKSYNISLKDCDLYVTLLPCSECAPHIIEAGIKSVKYLDDNNPRFKESFEETKRMFNDAGISWTEIPIEKVLKNDN